MENTNVTEITMNEARDADYIAGWGAMTSRQGKVDTATVAKSVNNVMGTNLPADAFDGTPTPDTLDIVGRLTPSNIKAIAKHVHGYASLGATEAERRSRRNRCHFCGQDTGGRDCRECI